MQRKMIMKRSSSPNEAIRASTAIPKRVRRTRRFSEGLVQLGSPPAKCEMKLFPLAAHSLRIASLIESVGDKDSEDSPIAIDLPDCPGDADIFRIVEDFSYGLMDEKDVSISNVVKLMVTCNFLEMDSLASRALKFLEETVFTSWESCLSVLATFDYNDGSQIGQGTLFDRCKTAFLRKIEVNLDTVKSKCRAQSMSCSLQCLVRVAELLPPLGAQLIYQSCRAEKFGLFYDTRFKTQIALSTHSRADHTFEGASAVSFYRPVDEGQCVQVVENLSHALPDWRRRSILVLHLAKSMHLENDFNFPSQKIRVSVLRWGFVCALLIEAVDLRRMIDVGTGPSENIVIANDLDEEIGSLQRLASRGLGGSDRDHRASAQHVSFRMQAQDLVREVIRRFKFDTLLSIVLHFRDFRSSELCIEWAAMLIDGCLKQHLKKGTFTVQQALLIYQEFPNDGRTSHAEIYRVFEALLRRKALSRREVLDLTRVLDYHKLSDEAVEKLMAALQFDCDPRLRERFSQMRHTSSRVDEVKRKEELIRLRDIVIAQLTDLTKVREELTRKSVDLTEATKDLKKVRRELTINRADLSKATVELFKVCKELNVKSADLTEVTADLKKARKELTAERADLTKATMELSKLGKELTVKSGDLAKATQDKRRAKRKLELLNRVLIEDKLSVEINLKEARHDLEVEQEKTTCQICFSRPRDALSLPCMHFLYCSECLQQHHDQSKTCPTCRGSTTGVLKCILSV